MKNFRSFQYTVNSYYSIFFFRSVPFDSVIPLLYHLYTKLENLRCTCFRCTEEIIAELCSGNMAPMTCYLLSILILLSLHDLSVDRVLDLQRRGSQFSY